METPLRIRNVLFKAFVINWVIIVLAWLMSLSGITTQAMATFFDFSADQTRMYMANMIGFWKVLNVVLFLVPAIALHWEYRTRG